MCAICTQAADGWRGLDWCRRWDCYIAHTGAGGHPPALQLPTSYNASVQAEPGVAGSIQRPPAWLPSGWSSLTGGSGGGGSGGSSMEAARRAVAGLGSSAGQPKSGPFKGRGHTLGGCPS